jgi:hypothetical protein
LVTIFDRCGDRHSVHGDPRTEHSLVS